MKILHIIDSLGLGGAQTVVKGIFEEQNNNNNIFLFALRERDIKTEINHKNVFVYPSAKKYSFKPIRELKNFIEKNNIDLLHCHLFKSQLFGLILKRKYFPNIKLIFHEHGKIMRNEGNFYEKHIYFLLMNRSQKNVNIFIAVSKATKKKLMEKAKINSKKIIVLYNFVDTKKFNIKNIKWNIKKEREKLGINKDDFVIGFVGRLSKVKGCDILIKALPNINFKYKVLIAGDGEERKKLESLAEKLKVRDKIIFLGYINNPLWVYSMIDVLIMPSRSESFGLSLIEAQAIKSSVVVSKIEVFDEIINNKKYLFIPNNYRDLADKILTITKQKKQNPIINIDNFSLNKYIKKLNDLYKNGI
jgi:L-malate glycosyltransferase